MSKGNITIFVIAKLCIPNRTTTSLFLSRQIWTFLFNTIILWQYWRHLHLKKKHHDDVIKWKHFPRYWPFVRGIHRSPVNSPHKGQWRGASMFSLICVWINSWVKQWWGWWFETLSCPLWRHRNDMRFCFQGPSSPTDTGTIFWTDRQPDVLHSNSSTE